jgi:hypothetical protein
MEASARRIEVGRVISESFSLYRGNVGALLGSAFVVFAIAGIAQGLLNDGGGVVLVFLGVVVSMVATALYTGFVVKLVEDVRADGRRDLGVGDLFSSAQHAILPLIGNGILKGIAVAIGFVLLIVPGLFLLTIWAVTSPAIVAERSGAIDAFSRSYQLVRGQAWHVFGVILVAFLIVIVVGAIAAAIGAAIGVAGMIVLAIIAGIATAPIPALVASIVFFDLGGSSTGSVPAPAAAAPGPAV